LDFGSLGDLIRSLKKAVPIASASCLFCDAPVKDFTAGVHGTVGCVSLGLVLCKRILLIYVNTYIFNPWSVTATLEFDNHFHFS